MCWGHPSLFHAATSLLNWYKMACMVNILHRIWWNLWACFLCVCNLEHWKTLKNYCGFNTKSYCSGVCGYHQGPKTLAKICRNICCCFRAVAAREKYPGFMLLDTQMKRMIFMTLNQFQRSRSLKGCQGHHICSYVFTIPVAHNIKSDKRT